MRAGPFGWLSERTVGDLVIAAIAVGGHVLFVRKTGNGDWLTWISHDDRLTVYGTSAGIIAGLGGLASIGIALYQAAGGDRAAAMRRLYGSELRRNWRALLLVAGAAALLCVVAQALDRTNDPLSARYVWEFALVLAAVRFGRLIWLLDRTLAVVDADLADKPRDEAPTLDPRWASRR